MLSPLLLQVPEFVTVNRPLLLPLLPVALGLAAVFLLLPRPKSYPPRYGAILGGLALVAAGWLLLPVTGLTPEVFLFYAFSALAVAAGVLTVTQRNPARAAVSFALVVLSTTGLFLLLAAPFLMAATIIIYAGAVVVTFLFVLMLAQQEGPSDADQRTREPLLASVAGAALLFGLLYALQMSYGTEKVDAKLAPLLNRLQTVRQWVDVLAALTKETAASEEATGLLELARVPLDQLADLRKDLLEWRETTEKEIQAPPDVMAPLDQALATLDTNGVVPLTDLVGKARRGVAVQPAEVEKQFAALSAALAEVSRAAQVPRHTVGFLKPAGERARSGSGFGGPPANLPLQDLRYDADGRPAMPHENVAYLGRTLFTDYLLAVELAGALLLIATVGAIVIAMSGRPT